MLSEGCVEECRAEGRSWHVKDRGQGRGVKRLREEEANAGFRMRQACSISEGIGTGPSTILVLEVWRPGIQTSILTQTQNLLKTLRFPVTRAKHTGLPAARPAAASGARRPSLPAQHRALRRHQPLQGEGRRRPWTGVRMWGRAGRSTWGEATQRLTGGLWWQRARHAVSRLSSPLSNPWPQLTCTPCTATHLPFSPIHTCRLPHPPPTAPTHLPPAFPNIHAPPSTPTVPVRAAPGGAAAARRPRARAAQLRALRRHHHPQVRTGA